MKRTYLSLSLILFFAVLTFGFIQNKNDDDKKKHPEIDWDISCVECHSDVTPEIFTEWEGSMHGQMNFGCYICHGDGEETFFAKGSDERCTGCHAGQEIKVTEKVNSCFDCHNGHTLKFHNN